MTYIENKLLEKLRNIERNNYILEDNKNYFIYSLEMMDNIGSTNSILRDDLIYATLLHWISNGIFDFKELKYLLDISLDDDHLFYKLGEINEDSIFKRSFSVLVVALILHEHRKSPFLTNENLYDTKIQLIKYMIKESDLRGYIEIKGWAHSVAHCADALDELSKCSIFNKNDLIEILHSIKVKVYISNYVYIDEESERMVSVVESIFKSKKLDSSEILDWIQTFTIHCRDITYIEKFHMKVNIKSFLRSLYFRIFEEESLYFVANEIIATLETYN